MKNDTPTRAQRAAPTAGEVMRYAMALDAKAVQLAGQIGTTRENWFGRWRSVLAAVPQRLAGGPWFAAPTMRELEAWHSAIARGLGGSSISSSGEGILVGWVSDNDVSEFNAAVTKLNAEVQYSGTMEFARAHPCKDNNDPNCAGGISGMRRQSWEANRWDPFLRQWQAWSASAAMIIGDTEFMEFRQRYEILRAEWAPIAKAVGMTTEAPTVEAKPPGFTGSVQTGVGKVVGEQLERLVTFGLLAGAAYFLFTRADARR